MTSHLLRTFYLLCLVPLVVSAQSITWVNHYGGGGTDGGVALACDANQNIYLLAYFSSTANFGGTNLVSNGGVGLALAKYSRTGAHLWSEGFSGTSGGVNPTAMALDASGNIFVCGYFTGTANFGGTNCVSPGQQDCFLAKYSSVGTHLWSMRFGSTNNDVFNSLAVDSGGNVVVAGWFTGYVDFGGGTLISHLGAVQSIILAKYSTAGAHVFSETFVANAIDYAYAVGVDKSDNIILAGAYFGTINFGGGPLVAASGGFTDFYVAKFNSAGVYTWAQRHGGTQGDTASAMSVDTNNDVIVGGTFGGTTDLGGGPLPATGPNGDMFLAKYSGTTGNYITALDINGGWPNIMTIDSKNNVIISGYFGGTVNFGTGNLTAQSGLNSAFTAKYTGALVPTWAAGYGGSSQGVGVTTDSSGEVVNTGFFLGAGTFGSVPLVTFGGADAYLLAFDTGSAICYIAPSGNDSTYVRGDIAHPAFTFSNILASAVAGDSIIMAAGTYNVSNSIVLLPSMAVNGAGVASTIITNWVDMTKGCCFLPSNNSSISNLSILSSGIQTLDPTFQAPIGTQYPNTNNLGFTNAIVANVNTLSHNDGIYIDTTNRCQISFYNCGFQTTWDVIAANFANHDIRMYGGGMSNLGINPFFGSTVSGLTIYGTNDTFSATGTTFYSDKGSNVAFFGSGPTINFESCQFVMPNLVAGQPMITCNLNPPVTINFCHGDVARSNIFSTYAITVNYCTLNRVARPTNFHVTTAKIGP